MPERFFIDADISMTSGVVIEGALGRHLSRSLRLRPGEAIVIVDGAGREHGVRLRSVVAGRVEGDVTWSREATGEPRLRITVIQALPRERMDDCIDVLVEAGAAEVRPVITERVVSRPSPDRIPQRLARWRAVATESAQLAGRGMVPQVHPPTTLVDALTGLAATTRVIACTFDGATSIADLDVDPGPPLALCIGPEGGFGDHDHEVLRAAGAEGVHLGERVLRTRYAGAIACELILARSGDLGTGPRTAPPA